MFKAIRERGGSKLARDSVKLIMGPWLHGGSLVMNSKIGDKDFGPDVQINYAALRVRWFDYHLRGVDNGIMNEPRVRIFVMGTNKWRDENEWPLARAVQTRFYLRAAHSGSINSVYDGTLSKQPPATDEPPNALESEPRNPIQSIGGDLHVEPMGVQDHRPVDQQSMTFTTAPLVEDLEVSGPSSVEIYLSSTADDTDVVAVLCDVRPDGYSQILRRNILRASRRQSLENPTAIEPGKIYKLTIPIYPVSNVFLKGHRLRLTVSTSSFPKWLPGHNKFADNNEDAPWVHATNTFYHDAQHVSALIVPVIPAK